MNKEFLSEIKKIYQKGDNIVHYLNNITKSTTNSTEAIMISYDFQSGSYIEFIKKSPEFIEKYTQAMADVINNLGDECQSVLEVGVGEATTLAHLIPKLTFKPSNIYGFDLAWSRIRYGIEYLKKRAISNAFLFMGDLFNIPIADSSIDIVYTSHSIEPNGGREKEALIELLRITKKYLILLEPAYEFADDQGKKRMKSHGYVTNLYQTAISLGARVKINRLFGIHSNPLNPTGLILIEKDYDNAVITDPPIVCPITKTPLRLIKESYFSEQGLLAYPVIDGVPCLLSDEAVIVTHYMDDFESKL